VRELHVLGVSDDGTTLLLASSAVAARPTHGLPLDDRLRAAVRGQLSPPGDRAESALPVREIQARLRAGDTPEAVAKAAGLPVARVQPYAVPVLAERARIVDEARAHIVHRSRGADPTRPLGELADAHLADVSGLKPDTVDWTASRRGDGAWVVSLTYAARGGRRSASWLWRPAERELTALDAAASRIGNDVAASAKRGAKKAPRSSSTASTGGKATARQRAPSRTAATTLRKTASAKPRARGRTAKAAATAGTAAKPAASKRATARRPARKPAVTAPPPVVPPTTTAGDAAAANGRRGAARVPVPSWSDVLLGVQSPPADTAARQRRPSRRRKA
jgi:hypothetical protein